MELDVVNFTNIDNENYEGMWGGETTVIKAGETRPFPKFLAEHYCKHLVNKILIRGGRDWSDQVAREPLEKKILGQSAKVEPVFEKPVQKEEVFAEVPKEEPKVEPIEALKLVCDVCGKVAKSNAGLAVHKKSHKS